MRLAFCVVVNCVLGPVIVVALRGVNVFLNQVQVVVEGAALSSVAWLYSKLD